MNNRPMAKVEEIRRRIDHPIVDADAHQLETVPVLLDYIREVGGNEMPDRFLDFLKHQGKAFLGKPFRSDELLEAVHRSLADSLDVELDPA